MRYKLFRDRAQAGRLLAGKLLVYTGDPDIIVLALPRGGVPVAFEVAQALRATLDVFLVREISVPGASDRLLGAVASGGVQLLYEDVIHSCGVSVARIEATLQRKQIELTRRAQLYRAGQTPLEVRGRTVLLIGDGLATGAKLRAAVLILRQLTPRRIIIAFPVMDAALCAELALLADATICALTPEPFLNAACWYENFPPTTDAEICDFMERNRITHTLQSSRDRDLPDENSGKWPPELGHPDRRRQ